MPLLNIYLCMVKKMNSPELTFSFLKAENKEYQPNKVNKETHSVVI